MRKKTILGFTLIEVMIVVAIVGILAAIAYPSYVDSVRKGRRAEAMSALEDVRLSQAKWRTKKTTYGTKAEISASDTKYYIIDVPSNTQTSFTATATAKAGTSQASDTGCTTFTVNQNGPVGDAAHIAKCWSR